MLAGIRYGINIIELLSGSVEKLLRNDSRQTKTVVECGMSNLKHCIIRREATEGSLRAAVDYAVHRWAAQNLTSGIGVEQDSYVSMM